MNAVIYFSPEGLAKAKLRAAQIEAALDTIRQEKLTAYTGSGDGWHDNPFFNKLEQDERSTAALLAEVKGEVDRGQVFVPRSRPTDAVRVGSIVEILKVETGREPVREVWEIGCFNDSDKDARRLGYNTPLAASIIGKEEGSCGSYRHGRPGDGSVEVDIEILALHAEWPAGFARVTSPPQGFQALSAD